MKSASHVSCARKTRPIRIVTSRVLEQNIRRNTSTFIFSSEAELHRIQWNGEFRKSEWEFFSVACVFLTTGWCFANISISHEILQIRIIFFYKHIRLDPYVTVTVIVSSKIDHFTPLMILHSIQSNSIACSNSMNCNCPSIWITFKFQIACCAINFRKILALN